MNKIEKINEFIGDNTVPQYIDVKIKEACDIIRKENKIKNKNRNKFLCTASILAVLVFTSTNNTVLADIKELIFGGRYGQIQDKGYVPSKEGIYSESNGIRLEFINGLSNSKLINLRLKISAKDKNKLNAIDNRDYFSSINTFTITDDQGRIINQYTTEGLYSPMITDKNGKKINLTSSYDEVIHDSDIDNGIIYLDLMFVSEEGNLEGIKGVNIKSDVIGDIKGNWNLDISFD